MTKQDMYDRLYEAAYDGTFPSLMPHPTNPEKGLICAYRGDGGARCAAGLFLKDEAYEPSMETKTVGTLINYYRGVESFDLPAEVAPYELSPIQRIHDGLAITARWDKELECEVLEKNEWNPDRFVERINDLSLFRDVVKKQPQGKEVAV